jgi:hypothetical protein
VQRKDIENFLSAFKSHSMHKHKRAPEESELTQVERSRLDRVEDMHLDLNHESAAAMTRRVEAKYSNDTLLDSRGACDCRRHQTVEQVPR